MPQGIRSLTRQVVEWLGQPRLEVALTRIAGLPPDKSLKPLFSCLCSNDPVVKWHAVSAMGQTVATLADQEMESARVVIRRFMWMLNDESGGIGWGVPEAMGEVLSCHAGLAEEYTHILVAFMREDGFYLELPTLQQGLLWGVARLAGTNPEGMLRRESVRYLLPYLQAADHTVIGLACLALGRLGDRQTLPALAPYLTDATPLSLYQEGQFVSTSVGQLARQAVDLLAG